MRTIPVDLILHSLLDLLGEHSNDSPPGIYAEGVALCISPTRLAEEWTHGAGTEQMAQWLVRRLDGEDMAAFPGGDARVNHETRAIEVAVARRLADTAFALTIEQDAEATARAAMLLRAAQAVVGLAVESAPRAEECSEERARMAVEMAALLADRPDIVAAGVTVAAKNGAITLTSPPPVSNPLDHEVPDHEIEAERDRARRELAAAETSIISADDLLKSIRAALHLSTGDDVVQAARSAHALSQEATDAALKMAQAHRDLAKWRGWGACWAVYPATPTDRERNMDDDGLRLAIAERISTPVWVMQQTNRLDGEPIDGIRVESMKHTDGHMDWRVTWHGVTLAQANNEFAAVKTAQAHLENFPADMLRRSHPKPATFKVGDRVRIVRKVGIGWVSSMDCTIGRIGTVTRRSDPSGYGRVEVKVDDAKDYEWFYAHEALERA